MGNLKPNGQRAKNAIMLIWIVLVVEIMSLISGYFQYDLLQSIANGNVISPEIASANDMREKVIGIVFLIVWVISGITFIQWFRRAYNNLIVKVGYLSHSEGWAAGSWFVPIISLYRPYHMMKELYQETEEFLDKKKININSNFTTDFLGWWWGLWIINNFLGQFEFRYSMNANTIDELTKSTIVSMVGNIIDIPLALITIKVINDYCSVELLLNEEPENEETITPDVSLV